MQIYIWYELPIDHKLIGRVEELATNEDHPTIYNRHPIFEWSPVHEMVDENIIIPDTDQILEG